MLASLLIALTLAAPLGDGGAPRERAKSYYSEGLEHYAKERYSRALKSFEMSLLLARFAFAETELLADGLRMASSSALRAGDTHKAPERALEYLDWAEKHGDRAEILRARNDVVEALLLAGADAPARDALTKAEAAAAQGGTADEKNRTRGLGERLRGIAPAESSGEAGAGPLVSRVVRSAEPAADPGEPEPSSDEPDEPEPPAVIVRRTVISSEPAADATPAPAATPTPAPPVTSATPPSPAPPAARPIATPASSPSAPVPLGLTDDMVLVPAGKFVMGDANGDADEKPTREIELAPFYIDRFEVTNETYRRFVTTSGYRPSGNWEDYAGPGHERDPVRGVTQEDALFFARAQGKRLPTEAEWERAARGPEGSRYAFGDAFSAERGRVGRGGDDGPVAVGSSEPGPWGIHDLTGNVMEWCADWYDAKAYRSPFSAAPGGPAKGTHHVARGGAWDASANDARNAARMAVPGVRSASRIGFRCVRDAK